MRALHALVIVRPTQHTARNPPSGLPPADVNGACMTEHKTMNTVIHAAFRRDLHRFDSALAAPEAATAARAAQLKTAWDNYQYQLHHHHNDEETIFWPAFRELGVDTSIMGELEGEHEAMVAALGAADSAMASYASAPAQDTVTAARTAIAKLRTTLDDHLAHEERDLEPFVIDRLGTPQFKAALRAVRAAHKGNAGTFFSWLDDGSDPDAKAGLRREVPAPVLATVKTFAGRDYRHRIAPVWR